MEKSLRDFLAALRASCAIFHFICVDTQTAFFEYVSNIGKGFYDRNQFYIECFLSLLLTIYFFVRLLQFK